MLCKTTWQQTVIRCKRALQKGRNNEITNKNKKEGFTFKRTSLIFIEA